MNMLIIGGFFGIAIIALVGLIFLVRHEAASSKVRGPNPLDNTAIQSVHSTITTQAIGLEEHEKRRIPASTTPLPTVDVSNETVQLNTSGQIPVVQAPMLNERTSAGSQIPVARSARVHEPAWLNEQIKEMEVDIAILMQQARDCARHIDTLKLMLIQLEQQQKQVEKHTSIDQENGEEDTG